MPTHKLTESSRAAGQVTHSGPAFWPQEDFPRGYEDGDLIRYNAETEEWERVSEEEFKKDLDLEAGSHAQGTDQALDTGGENEVTAEQAKSAAATAQDGEIMLTPKSSPTSGAEGTMFYCSDDNHVYVGVE